MGSYKDIIEVQRERLNQNIKWWPLYLYHFTDVNNAVSIIKGEYIYAREIAKSDNLMASENASISVINITDDTTKEYARLYMRPKTPTQYHNEGYKPKHIRNAGLDANCPVPIFFFLDAEKILSMEGVEFVEKGLAGHSIEKREFLNGPEHFETLNFEKIFHNGPHNKGSDITQYRHTEVVRQGGIPISNIIRGIACRSVAEKQTLLFLLKNQSYDKYDKYKSIINYRPGTDAFFNNGIFIKKVKLEDDKFIFFLNDSRIRYNLNLANGKDVYMSVNIEWLDKNQNILSVSNGHATINYGKSDRVTYSPKYNINAERVKIKVTFDDCLMYENVIELNKYIIV